MPPSRSGSAAVRFNVDAPYLRLHLTGVCDFSRQTSMHCCLPVAALVLMLGTVATLVSPAAAGGKVGIVPALGGNLVEVPTQVIIELTAMPAALRLPAAARQPGASTARKAALTAAAAPVSAQHAAFQSAARGINFRLDFTYQHVCPAPHLHMSAVGGCASAVLI